MAGTTAAALAAGAALLAGCSSDVWHSASSGAATAPSSPSGTAAPTAAGPAWATTSAPRSSATRSAAASRTPAGDTDSVQTDPPVTPGDSAIVLTYAGWAAGSREIQASAFAQGHVDADATCALSASRAGTPTVTGSPTPATPGPSSTDCGALTLRLPPAASGTWKVSVVYRVGSTRLTSATTEVQVP